MQKAMLTKEIYVETPNSVGTAARLTRSIYNDAAANIHAAWGWGHKEFGCFSFLTDKNQKVMDVLRSDYPNVKEREVLVFDVKDVMGDMAHISELLGKGNLNIEYIYAAQYNNKPVFVVSTNDNKKALSLFNT